MKTIILPSIAAVSLTLMFIWNAYAQTPGRVTAEELKAMLSKKEPVVLIDVRTPEENAEARIPGSVLMPLDTLESTTKLPEGGRIILYCRAGKRSLKAKEILEKKGFKGLTDLEGGITAWTAAGGVVDKGPAKK